MIMPLIIASVVVLMCIFSSKVLYRFGVPSLLIFILLGMVFGSEGIVGIPFENYRIAEQVGSFGLILIIFYGGFCANWKIAKPVVGKAVAMSTLGVVVTAGLTGLFCTLVLNITLLEGLLIGSIVASTDAASVFSILRSQKLNLKGGLASLLEIESGSNDPFAYMLTITILSLMNISGEQSILQLLIFQIFFGLLIGFILAKASSWILKNITFEIEGLYPLFVMAIAVLAYSLSSWIGGNGYLSVYIASIIIGNSKIQNKKSLVKFLDGISWLMQIMLFFILGLLSFPSHLGSVLIPGSLISLFLIFVARPIAAFGILGFLKVPLKHKLFVSWVGIRGASSIVFAILAVTNKAVIQSDIFHIVFFIALFSVALQGTLIAPLAKKLDLVDNSSAVLKTFNDYQEESNTKLYELQITPESYWVDKTIMDANIPDEILVVMIKREQNVIHPKGATMIKNGDVLVLSGDNFDSVIS
ncbi:potassium/proton antiporter [Clostridium lacusfryxellense]|uniref:potassium/proton antiporter n=1 Tax=Clostridium lacusfryxellense TaxID=205328 RepID=UPI001C0B85D6|nr:potassium/proton antiporter [Clostridium lacusfryxellense]MBU3112991.1 potassium/proton antiporter [Clostridium lacusfryxellense]